MAKIDLKEWAEEVRKLLNLGKAPIIQKRATPARKSRSVRNDWGESV